MTRDNGTFRASPIPPGRVRAIVRHPSYLEGVSKMVSLAPSGEAHVKVVMGLGATLEGRVLDDRRQPLGRFGSTSPPQRGRSSARRSPPKTEASPSPRCRARW